MRNGDNKENLDLQKQTIDKTREMEKESVTGKEAGKRERAKDDDGTKAEKRRTFLDSILRTPPTIHNRKYCFWQM